MKQTLLGIRNGLVELGLCLGCLIGGGVAIPVNMEAGYYGGRPYQILRELRKKPNTRIAQSVIAVYETIGLPFYALAALCGSVDEIDPSFRSHPKYKSYREERKQ
ncbi:MAG: hypothetical protein HYW23_00150 [Candidatus Aenigmarchaeota archaeon]|nr:hypothetical protein [Candidatus Aenigmarchaeota archaeon]